MIHALSPAPRRAWPSRPTGRTTCDRRLAGPAPADRSTPRPSSEDRPAAIRRSSASCWSAPMWTAWRACLSCAKDTRSRCSPRRRSWTRFPPTRYSAFSTLPLCAESRSFPEFRFRCGYGLTLTLLPDAREGSPLSGGPDARPGPNRRRRSPPGSTPAGAQPHRRSGLRRDHGRGAGRAFGRPMPCCSTGRCSRTTK